MTTPALPPALDEKERRENEARTDQLIGLIKSGEAVLFVGSGSSAQVGHVTWGLLLENLETLAVECGGSFTKDRALRENDPLIYAQAIRNHIGSVDSNLARYYNKLYDLFKPRKPPYSMLHKELVSLPFRAIVTTNYDMVLEHALGGPDNSLVVKELAAPVREFLLSIADATMTKRVAHLHGRYDDLDEIILTSSDYEKTYGFSLAHGAFKDEKWTLHRKLIWALLATRRVVFIGFGLKDPYMMTMLDVVSRDLWFWDRATHFAIMDISAQNAAQVKRRAEELKRKLGIDVVFYETTDNSHRGLDVLVTDLAYRVLRPAPTTLLDDINSRMLQGPE